MSRDVVAPIAVACVPDRSLSSLGAFVSVRYGVRLTGWLQAGNVGIVVRDSKNLCKPGQIAVQFPGRDYIPVYERVISKVKPR